ncbi:MAG: hypothetical protein PHG48_07450, partial [Eubacteriales bacterium]|nr:hypothetical protein [Eubacteriales bacterium]
MQPTQTRIKKAVTRAVLTAALVITATIFLLNSVIINTVLSGRHFSSFYDRHQPLAVLLDTSETEAQTAEGVDTAGGGTSAGNNAGTDTGTDTGSILYYADQYLDREWFPDEPGVLIKGLFKYITGMSGSLPTMNISPVKGILADVVTYEVIVPGPRDEAAFKIALIFKAFDSLIKSHGIQQGDAAIPDSKLDAIMNSAEFKALGIEIDKTTLNDVLTSYVNMRASGTGSADIMQTIVIKVLDGMAGLVDVYDELDLNVFSENL